MYRLTIPCVILVLTLVCGCLSESIRWVPPAERSANDPTEGGEFLNVESIYIVNTTGHAKAMEVQKTWVGVLETINLGDSGAGHIMHRVKNTQFEVVGIIQDTGKAYRYGPGGETIYVGRWAYSIDPDPNRSAEFSHCIRNILNVDGTVEFNPFSVKK